MVSCKSLVIGRELVKVRHRAVWKCEVDKQGDKPAYPTSCWGTPCGIVSRSCFEPRASDIERGLFPARARR